MGIDRPGIEFGRNAPNLLEQFDTRQQTPRVLEQEYRQIEFRSSRSGSSS